MKIFMVCAVTWVHIDIQEPCCPWGPYWCEWPALPPETIVVTRSQLLLKDILGTETALQLGPEVMCGPIWCPCPIFPQEAKHNPWPMLLPDPWWYPDPWCHRAPCLGLQSYLVTPVPYGCHVLCCNLKLCWYPWAILPSGATLMWVTWALYFRVLLQISFLSLSLCIVSDYKWILFWLHPL